MSEPDWYLGWEADRVPVWRRKLQLPFEDLIKQLLLDIILTEEKEAGNTSNSFYKT